MKWVTAANTQHAAARTAHGTVLFDSQNEVLAARRLETALAAQHGTKKNLIQADPGDQQPTRQAHDCRPKETHDGSVPRFRASCWASFGNDSAIRR
jgi:hypothetical protein